MWMECTLRMSERASERQCREKNENETRSETHNSNYQIKNVNLHVLFASEWVFGQSAKRKNDTTQNSFHCINKR